MSPMELGFSPVGRLSYFYMELGLFNGRKVKKNIMTPFDFSLNDFR